MPTQPSQQNIRSVIIPHLNSSFEISVNQFLIHLLCDMSILYYYGFLTQMSQIPYQMSYRIKVYLVLCFTCSHNWEKKKKPTNVWQYLFSILHLEWHLTYFSSLIS